MNQHKNRSVIHEEVPCPFCSLLCDDLSIQQTNGKLKIAKNGCHKAVQYFETERTALAPSINGKKCSLDDAIKHTAEILQTARQPLITGMGTDVSGIRAALALAEKTGGMLDHMHGNAAMTNVKVLQDRGWITTTLAEIKNRADLILFAGTNASTNYPRFFERVVWNKYSLNNITHRDIIYIGDNLDTRNGVSPDGRKPLNINCKDKYIGEIIATIHALVVGNKIHKTSVGGLPLSQLETLASTLKKARYGVVVWAPGELNVAHSELTVQSLCEMIKYLNRTTRFAGFSLGGNDGGASTVNACTWLSGYPLRVSYATGAPDYNSYRYSTERALLHNETDAILWISSFGAKVNLPKTRAPVILLSDKYSESGTPDVFIPVGTPGIDHKGHLVRTDIVVSLCLKELLPGLRVSAAAVLDRILQELEAA